MTLSIIPEPKKIITKQETVFTLTKLCEIEACQDCDNAVNSLKKFLSDAFSMTIYGGGKEKIIFTLDPALKEESYTLCVTQDTVTITGGDAAGVFYGVQSLKQLLFQGELALSEIYIEDSPRFSYRGFMLDCGRYFFTKEAVIVFLEMMALHKLNHFHWHLSEDQGFRAQIPSKLLLTEIGSYRSHTNFNKRKHFGYYTTEDMKEIVAYAHSLHIKVIPEIDSPGHVVSMIAAYPELSCFNRDLTVATSWGIKYDVLCVSKESTFDFMKEVFDDLSEIFTDGVFHLGGDEVPTERWKLCPHCQKLMKDLGLKDEGELHTYYLDKIASYLSQKGIESIMWNDKVKPYMVNKNITWQLWNGDMNEQDVVNEINSSRKFILSCSDYYYINFPYALTNLKKAYDFEPYYEGIDSDKADRIMGIEGCLWTEFIPTMQSAGYHTYPRLGALSESAWSAKENKSYENFESKLPSYYSLLKGYGIDFATKKQAMPGIFRALANKLYWERRKLCWASVSNLIDNALVKIKYSDKENKND